MEQLLLQLCGMLASVGAVGANTDPCYKAMDSYYIYSKANIAVNNLQKMAEVELYERVDRQYVYSAVGVGYLYNAIKTSDYRLGTPCNCFLCKDLYFDVNPTLNNYTLNLSWTLP